VSDISAVVASVMAMAALMKNSARANPWSREASRRSNSRTVIPRARKESAPLSPTISSGSPVIG
jgi:hypothetical protein